ncbi:hypothetical protein F5880DRAFT_1735083 [Lentinula raphanica]|nr:hypothetical protein F5880DRAFT_1735083 [Lentinula raphanica]
MKAGPSQVSSGSGGSSHSNAKGGGGTKHGLDDGPTTGEGADDIFVSVSEDIEMAAVDEKQKKVLGKKAKRVIYRRIAYMQNPSVLRMSGSNFQQELDLLCGEHNTCANVNLNIEGALVDSIVKAGYQAMSIATYRLTFFRTATPWQSNETFADIWGYTNSSDLTPFRPLLTGYLTRKFIRSLNVGCGTASYTVYELGWSSLSSLAMKTVFRSQRETLASVIPQGNISLQTGPITFSYIEERWCNDSPPSADLTSNDSVAFVLARDCVIKYVKACNIWKEFQAENYNAYQDMATRTGNVLWLDAKRAGNWLSAERCLQQNMLVSIKAELREVEIVDNLTGICQRTFCLLAHEVYLVHSI